MAKYLFHGSYTVEGVKALLNEGGSGRQAAVDQAAKSLGGSVEAYYFAFGGEDFYLIMDLPDHASAAAASLMASASGALAVKTTVLLTPEEIDEATKKTIDYRPPGQ